MTGLQSVKIALKEFIQTHILINLYHYEMVGSRDSSVGIATGYGPDDQDGQEFESR
jgi:hypothetical protein